MLKFKKIIFAAVFALSIFNFGCSNDSDITSFSETVDSSKSNSDSRAKGLGVKVILPAFGNDASENSRSVAYRLSETKSFKLTVIKSDVVVETKTANLPCSSMEVTLTDFGTYTFKLDALDFNDTEIGTGTKDVIFNKGETETKEIEINVQSKNRSTNLGLKLTVEWPEAENCYKVSDATYFYVNIKNAGTIVYAAEISNPTTAVQIPLGTYGEHSLKVVATNKYGFIVGKGETDNVELSDETDYKNVSVTVEAVSYPTRTEGYTGKTVEFGEWPQTKADVTGIELTETKKTYDGAPEYSGSDGNRYVKVTGIAPTGWLAEKRYFNNGDQIINGQEYYFKVEPIVWRIIATYSDGSQILMADRIILAGTNKLGSNDYSKSNGRNYLNSTSDYASNGNKGFYAVAFDGEQNEKIIENQFTSNRGDKVTIFTKDENYDSYYGFVDNNARKKTSTDYVLSQNGKNYWWTSSPESTAFGRAYYVGSDGVGNNGVKSPNDTDIGYVPVIVIAN